MDHITDYVRWYRDIPFSVRPMCDADNLAFSALAYLKFPDWPWNGVGYTLRQCYEELRNTIGIQLMTTDTDGGMEDFVKHIATSRRFGQLIVSDYVDVFCEEGPIQFSAITFHIDAHTKYIAFRGTDSSLAGWKEDFMLCFTIAPAQELAVAYLKNHITPGNRYYVGGHSKGANLALYGTCMLEEKLLAQVEHIWINDGPGLCKDVLDPQAVARIDSRTTMIQPEYDVIGKLFCPGVTDARIIQSSQRALLQHSIFSWGISYGELLETNAFDPKSLRINHIFNRWIESVPLEDRKAFTDEFFDAIEQSGAKSVFELNPESFEQLYTVIREGSTELRDIFRKIPAAALEEAKDSTVQRLQEHYDKLIHVKLPHPILRRESKEELDPLNEQPEGEQKL